MTGLPTSSPGEEAAVTALLASRFGKRRLPRTTAPLLVVLVKMHRFGQTLPSREEMANHLGISMDALDGAIRTAKIRGLIDEQYHPFVYGDPRRAQRHVLGCRYWIPCDALRRAVLP